MSSSSRRGTSLTGATLATFFPSARKSLGSVKSSPRGKSRSRRGKDTPSIRLSPDLSLSPKDRVRDLRLRRRYGLSLAQYEKLLALQKNQCAICDRPFNGDFRKFLDHDHYGVKRVRGILCYRCNKRLLGRGLEHGWLHKRAAEYLESKFDARDL